MDKLAAAQHASMLMRKIPPATADIFRRLMEQDVKFFEAGSLTQTELFISGTINGLPFTLNMSWSGVLELK